MALAEQTGGRRPALRQPARRLRGGFVVKVREDLLNHHWVFDAGDDPDRPAAGTASLDVDIENSLEPLCPCHRRSPFGGRWRFIGYPGLVAPAPLCRRHQGPVLAVRRKYPMKPGKVDSWPGHQRGQAGNEIQRLKDHVRGAIPVRCLQLVAHVAVWRQR